MTALFANSAPGAAPSMWLLTYSVGALLIGRALLRLRGRRAYSCPARGSKRPDGHTEQCPWRSRQ